MLLVVIAIVVMTIDHKFYDFFAYLIYGIVILMLLGVLVAGREINGARSWFVSGGFQIQPSEFAKPAVALALAKYLSEFNINVTNLRTLSKSSCHHFCPCRSNPAPTRYRLGPCLFFFYPALYRQGFPAVILLILLIPWGSCFL